MCIDYRDVNARIIKDAYAIPNAHAILDWLRCARNISKIDLKQVFLNAPMEESS